jgi:hypothetical protein
MRTCFPENSTSCSCTPTQKFGILDRNSGQCSQTSLKEVLYGMHPQLSSLLLAAMWGLQMACPWGVQPWQPHIWHQEEPSKVCWTQNEWKHCLCTPWLDSRICTHSHSKTVSWRTVILWGGIPLPGSRSRRGKGVTNLFLVLESGLKTNHMSQVQCDRR